MSGSGSRRGSRKLDTPLGHALAYMTILLVGVFAMFMTLTLFTIKNMLTGYKD